MTTLHFTQPKHKFYDTTLNPNVGYAKHAISIDESRADFARVGRAPTEERAGERDDHGWRLFLAAKAEAFTSLVELFEQ